MNDGTKVKVPAACLLRGTFGGPLRHLQYVSLAQDGQVFLRHFDNDNAILSNSGAQPGGTSTPGTDRSGRHGDTPHAREVPGLASPDAEGCARELAAPTPARPPKKRRTRDGHPGLFRGQLVRRPMTSVVRTCALVNSSAFAARHSAEGREMGRG